jgi:hypothetical protein
MPAFIYFSTLTVGKEVVKSVGGSHGSCHCDEGDDGLTRGE